MFNRARRTIRFALTLLLLAFAAFAIVGLWEHYMVAPWTRDGQVRVQVADIAPQVPGQIVKLLVQDNQFIHKGDLHATASSKDRPRSRFGSSCASSTTSSMPDFPGLVASFFDPLASVSKKH